MENQGGKKKNEEDIDTKSSKKNKINNSNIINDDKSSLQFFIDNPSEINKDNLKELLDLINKDIQNIIYYYIPFLKIFPNLIKLYIESDLDEVKEEKKEYYKIFEELKKHVFINRNCLSPIYEYFSDILYNIENNKNVDEKFSKFPGVHGLWKMFYNNIPNNLKENKGISSFCINGGYLQLVLLKDNLFEDLKIDENSILSISIYFNKILFENEINLNSYIICIQKRWAIGLMELNADIFKNKKINDLNVEKMEIEISKYMIKIMLNEEEAYKSYLTIKIYEIFELYLLKDFYAEISKIDICLFDQIKKKILLKQVFEPFRETYNKNNKMFILKYSKDCKIKLLNYLDKNFNLLEYFGGLKPLIPFVSLINGIYDNQIKFGTKDKIVYLQEFIPDIFFVLNQYYDYNIKNNQIIKEKNNEKDKSINNNELETITIFFLYLLFNTEIIPKEIILCIINNTEEKINDKNINMEKFKEIKLFISNNKNNFIIESFINIYNKTYNEENNSLNNNKNNNNKNNNNIINNKFENDLKSLFNKYNINQLYRHYVKELFIYNRYWSNKKLFFGNNKNDKLKLKYKQLTYYTRNYQQPILYPILEFDRNYPKFSKYKGNMFLKEGQNINDIEMVNYNFNLKENIFNF